MKKNRGELAESQAILPADERDLLIAYLSYALEDARSLNPIAFYLLQLAVESLIHDTAAKEPVQLIPSKMHH